MSKLATLRTIREWVNRFRSGDTLDHLEGVVAIVRGAVRRLRARWS